MRNKEGGESLISTTTGDGTRKLTGSLASFTADTPVQKGTLLLGALDSVFADSDEITFTT